MELGSNQPQTIRLPDYVYPVLDAGEIDLERDLSNIIRAEPALFLRGYVGPSPHAVISQGIQSKEASLEALRPDYEDSIPPSHPLAAAFFRRSIVNLMVDGGIMITAENAPIRIENSPVVRLKKKDPTYDLN
ncbi:MAG TPA: hypothetical protein VHB73_04730 [Alphaproteobacteria bacterium]|nr:hypothetical protein [Alphaproteobacteria bacterium]